MKRPSLRNLLVIIFVSLDVIIIVFIILSLRESVKMGSEISDFEKREREFVKAARTIKNFDEEETVAELQRFEKKIPLDVALPLEAMRQVSGIAKELDIQELKLSLGQEEAKPFLDLQDITALPFKANLVCEYEQLLSFLERLSSSEVLINVESLVVKRNPKIIPLLETELALNAFTTSSKEQTATIPIFRDFGNTPED